MQTLLLSDLLASNLLAGNLASNASQCQKDTPTPPLSWSSLPPCVLTIGNFDGVHLGHQAMLKQVLDMAGSQGLASAMMVFEPQPREFFSPDDAPARLSNLAEKTYLLADIKHDGKRLDYLIVAEFDEAFRSLSADEFARLLDNRLNVKALVLGDDFRFGHDRTGDSAFLRSYGFTVSSLQTVVDVHDDSRISSTRIRTCLAEGELGQAGALLGHEYFMLGTVTDGDKIGRTLDFPTANIALNRLKPAVHGIYGADVQLIDGDGAVIDMDADGGWRSVADKQDGQWQAGGQIGVAGTRADSLFAAVNIGVRPSIDDRQQWRLEVHLPKFAGDLYGRRLKVTLLHFLHGERRYDGLDALKAGIAKDVQALLAWRGSLA